MLKRNTAISRIKYLQGIYKCEGAWTHICCACGYVRLCIALIVAMALELLEIRYRRYSEICNRLLMICKCFVEWFILQILILKVLHINCLLIMCCQ